MEKFAKFAAVGFVNTAVNYAAYCALLYCGVPYLAASFLAWCAAVSNSFFMNKSWTFSVREKAWLKSYAYYVLANSLSVLLNLIVLEICVRAGMSKYLAQLAAIAITLPVNFLLCKIIFEGARKFRRNKTAR
ncbi:MAG: GtrA family protein [Opitutales bacterium]|nr:GtrA family protein [Opitutales bacterium]